MAKVVSVIYTKKCTDRVLDLVYLHFVPEMRYTLQYANILFYFRSGSLTEADVKQWMSLKLSAHKQPNGGVVFVDSIPKSAAGKILRKDLVGK